MTQKDNFLGPGSYNYTPTIGENSKLVCSQYKTNGNTKINPIPLFQTIKKD